MGAWGPGQRLLACGAAVVAELRAAVRHELGYSCSAGGCLCCIASFFGILLYHAGSCNRMGKFDIGDLGCGCCAGGKVSLHAFT